MFRCDYPQIELGQHRPSQQVAGLLAEALQIAPKERARFLGMAKGGHEAESSGVGGERKGPPTSLPAHLTSLIGREAVLKEVVATLKRDEVRLFTLTGSPGIGKTCLALQAAYNPLSDFSVGVFLVPLAPVRDPALVAHTIASVLGLRHKGSEPLSLTLKEHLREQRALLVLDNFEQVVEAAPLIGELMWSCPQIKILVTSRAALNVRGEQEFSVPPLEGPKPGRTKGEDYSALSTYSAVALFVERAQAVDPAFSLTELSTMPHNRGHLRQIGWAAPGDRAGGCRHQDAPS